MKAKNLISFILRQAAVPKKEWKKIHSSALFQSIARRASQSETEWRGKAKSFAGKANKFKRLFQKKKFTHPDDFFFSFEDLPMFGKEYWFLYFSAPKSDCQAVFTFGRADVPVKVNNTSVSVAGDNSKKTCAAVCWLYGKKKIVAIDSLSTVRIAKTRSSSCLEAKSSEGSASICGKYPKFEAVLAKGGKNVFTASISAPKKGTPYELVELFRSPVTGDLGAVMVNYYFKFRGKMGGKQIYGDAYLQKVVAVIPLTPWNWVRVHFAKGAAMDFFAAKPLGDTPAELHFACNDYLEINGIRLRPGELHLESWLFGTRRKWLLTGRHFFMSMETYALQPFRMKQKTTFSYDEYFVRVTDFAYTEKGKTYTLADLGAGSGIVEDAYGYLF